jgi:hypothetical protein
VVDRQPVESAMAERLIDDVFTALDEQTVVVRARTRPH